MCHSQAGEAAFQCKQMRPRNGRACGSILYDPFLNDCHRLLFYLLSALLAMSA